MAKEAVVKLTSEMRQRLEDMQGDIDTAEANIATMKKLGMDTKVLEEKIEWAKEVKKTLLSEFSD